MNDTTRHLIDNIGARASHVARNAEESRISFQAEAEAEAEVLALAIKAARPALPALASRIEIATGDFALQGLYVGDLEFGAGPLHGSGSLGDDLFLMRDGQLLRLDYEGDSEAWTSAQRIIEPSEAVMHYRLTTILLLLSRALDAHLKGATVRRTRDAEARAEKLRQAAEMLRAR